MRGVILAGGTGSRLSPLTNVVSKHLLPVFDKPMIYYPISTLMAAQIKDIAIIVNPEYFENYQRLLGDGSKWGINFKYFIQSSPKGIAEAYLIASEFIGDENVALILGDNIFVGPGMGRALERHKEVEGAHVLLYPVNNPENYGVAEVDSKGSVTNLVEKPKNPRSRLALTGLIFSDNKSIDFARNLKPSKRNELEITDLLNCYIDQESLNSTILDRGTAWLDMGQTTDLFAASEFVKVVQERQGLKIAVPEEIAWRNKWISNSDLIKLASEIHNIEYSGYLQNLPNFMSYD